MITLFRDRENVRIRIGEFQTLEDAAEFVERKDLAGRWMVGWDAVAELENGDAYLYTDKWEKIQ